MNIKSYLQVSKFIISLLFISLWWSFNVSTVLKFKYCYNKCVKRFFGYNKYDSATAVFMELKLPTANTVLHNHTFLFKACWKNHINSIVSLIRDVLYIGLHHCLNVCECVPVLVCCLLWTLVV